MMDDYKKYEPIFNSWYIKKSIGKGSFGEVFEIVREEYGTSYKAALKVISVPQDKDEIKGMMAEGTSVESISNYYEDILKEIINENNIMSELKGNSNIVSYEDHAIIKHTDDYGYDVLIRMELLTPLVDYMLENSFDENKVIKLGIDMCKALELCEKKNIIHRDIKPQNIFVSDNGDFKLGDFGIARTMEKTIGEMSKKGTYTYMAPEVYRGYDYGATVDIYSLGIVMYCLLNANRAPFLPTPPQTVTHSQKQDATNRRMRGEALPLPANASIDLGAIVLRACAFDPDKRYQSAREMRRQLENLQHQIETGETVGAMSGGSMSYDNNPPKYYGTASSSSGGVRVNPGSLKEEPASAGTYSGKKSSGKTKTIAIIAASLLFVALAFIGYNLFLSNSVSPDDIEIISKDVNFSQSRNFEADGVDVLFKIKNNSDEAIKGIDFKLTLGDTELENKQNNEKEFDAFGYIEPESIGYMYSHIYVDKNAKKNAKKGDNGTAEITEVKSIEKLENYEMPYGSVTDFDKLTDSYDVVITNPNDESVGCENSIVIAVISYADELEGAWGCGKMDYDLEGNAQEYYSKVIYDPGFKYNYSNYDVFVIDRDYIDEK